MNSNQLRDLLQYRMQEARETLDEADILLNVASQRGAINRAYYAMFYALQALLATRQLGSSSHGAALALFDREFVKTGLFPRSLSQSLHLAFNRRQTHDYGNRVSMDQPVAEQTVIDARTFVAAVEEYLYSTGYLLPNEAEPDRKL